MCLLSAVSSLTGACSVVKDSILRYILLNQMITKCAYDIQISKIGMTKILSYYAELTFCVTEHN